jgi:hypothetical protein
MTKNELNNEYFEWMYQLVCSEKRFKRQSYRGLLNHLHNTPFIYTIEMDSNRATDGIDLRYRFGYENGYQRDIITAWLDDRPCSILEMMVALSIRCEEHIMDDPTIGNRTGQWFWGMIMNLGLNPMDDLRFSAMYTNDIINRFLNHQYKQNGEGGLFTVHDKMREDLRRTEIWYQMCWYLNEVLAN